MRVVNRRELDFLLYEMFDVEKLLSSERFAAYDRESVRQFLDTAESIAEDIFLPIAALVDKEEPAFVDGKAIVPKETKTALQAFADAGFFALTFDEDAGGLQAPWFLYTAISGMFTCANVGVTNYAFLTIAAANLLNAFGTEDLKRRFLAQMLAGSWFGTMCLSEPQAGSSLADIRTTATEVGDGIYSIRGSKMWISGGDHELTDNIVHMVLAKIPGGPAGTKGISLFLVPKRRVDQDGNLGELNHVQLAGLNHKMGQRATTNCLLNFGEGGETLGYLIGEPHRGIEYMFHMMNEARLGVGHASVMAAQAGYFASAEYAATRPQGRPIDQRDPQSPQVAIVEHADVRRMLLAQKAAVEGAQALCFYCATLIDQLRIETDAEKRRQLSNLLGLLTPVVKSWPSEHCLEANKWAIQVLGGYGYTRDYPVERLYRDNRLNHIHEGTFGIQGMDLLNRKVAGDRGATLDLLISEMKQTVEEASTLPRTAELVGSMQSALGELERAAETLIDCQDVKLRSANATVFLDAFGHVVIGWFWLRQSIVAEQALDGDVPETDRSFYQAKVVAARYFIRHELPLAATKLSLCASLDDTALVADPALFAVA